MKILQLGRSIHQIEFIRYCSNFGEVTVVDPYGNTGIETWSKGEIKHFASDLQDNILEKVKPNIVASHASDIAERVRIKLTAGKRDARYKLTAKCTARMLINEVSNILDMRRIEVWNGIDYDRKLIVKPNIASGSRGVTVINAYDKENLEESIEEAKKNSIDQNVHIELFVENAGKKYFCEGYWSKEEGSRFFWGESIQRKNTLINDGWQEIRQHTEKEIAVQLQRFIEEIAKRIGKYFFPYNIDFFVIDGKVVIIEIAPRPGGNGLGVALDMKMKGNYNKMLLEYYALDNKKGKINLMEYIWDDNLYSASMTDGTGRNLVALSNCIIKRECTMNKGYSEKNEICRIYQGN